MANLKSSRNRWSVQGLRVDGRTGPVAWEDEDETWKVTFTLDRNDRGETVISGLRVRLSEGRVVGSSRGLTSEIWKSIRFSAVSRYVRVSNTERASSFRSKKTKAPAGRKPTHTPSFYRGIREEYRGLVEKGDPHPAKTLWLRKRIEYPGVTRSAVRSWIMRATGL